MNMETIHQKITRKEAEDSSIQMKWFPTIFLAITHAIFVYCIYLLLMGRYGYKSFLFQYIYGVIGIGIGTTAGAHRLWTHRSYKAKLPLRIFLMLAQTSAVQKSLFEWVRDHRIHHKYSDTNADPHNINRGFFFSHCGWLMCKRHSEVVRKGKQVDMSDITEDPVVQFQTRHLLSLTVFLGLALPVLLDVYLFNSSLVLTLILRIAVYVGGLNCTWAVNSAAHSWGMKPYDRTINPSDNKFVSLITVGEGWHNYHHVFPWDYRTAELAVGVFNLTKIFIDSMWALGLAYDLKMASREMINNRMIKSGDLQFAFLPKTSED